MTFTIGAFSIKNHLTQSFQDLESGNFEKALEEVDGAHKTLSDSRDILKSAEVLKRIGFSNQVEDMEQTVNLSDEGIEGVRHAILGSKLLFNSTKIISGEERGDIGKLYTDSQTELSQASVSIAKVKANLSDEDYLKKLPPYIKTKVVDLSVKLDSYFELVEKAKAASYLLPQITAVEGFSKTHKKTYLVLLQNNLELRAGGGFIGSYGKITFENGKLTNIYVDDIYNLDGGLKEVIEPPLELKNDLGVNRFYLRDSNTEPDFPTSAKQAEFFYRKIAGEQVAGVFALDLSGSGKLLTAVGGVDLPEYGEHVDSVNLFEKAISHAEVNFFPGSQAKKNYLTSLQTQLFNKIFYLSKQNWPAIISALGKSLDEKHTMVYLSDSFLFSYLVSQNWAGILPRGVDAKIGETDDFIASIDSNMGANKSNYFLERKIKLETTIGKEGQIFHKLTINYKNNSPSDVFPAGKYKNRYKLYVPLGSKLVKATYSGEDITAKFTSFSDYGRAGYTTLLEVLPKSEKELVIDYSLQNPLSFKDGESLLKIDIFKQAGVEKDDVELALSYPINFKIESGFKNTNQEIKINTDLSKDRSFLFKFSNK